MKKTLTITSIIIICLATIYLFVVPFVWTIMVSGRTGVTTGGENTIKGQRVQVDSVIPCFNHHLWCYRIWTPKKGQVGHPIIVGGEYYIYELELE